MIGKLVKRKKTKQHKFFGVGVVLDYKSTGWLYPSTELKVHFPNCETGSRIATIDIEYVEFVQEDKKCP